MTISGVSQTNNPQGALDAVQEKTKINLHKKPQSESGDEIEEYAQQELGSRAAPSAANPGLISARPGQLLNAAKTLASASQKLIDADKELSEQHNSVSIHTNSWFASATVALFFTSNEIAHIIANMAREDSKFKKEVFTAALAMAKDAKSLSEASGEMRAAQHRLDALNSMVDFVANVAKVAINLSTISARNKAEKDFKDKLTTEQQDKPEDKKLAKIEIDAEARKLAAASIDPAQQTQMALIDAASSWVKAGISEEKAQIDIASGKIEGAQSLINKTVDLLFRTCQDIAESSRADKDILAKLTRILESALEARGRS